MNRSINELFAAEYYHQTTSANSRYSLFIDSSTLFISYSRLETVFCLSCCVSFFKKKNISSSISPVWTLTLEKRVLAISGQFPL